MVNGHKIWTSYSDVADWCLLLARTDPEAKRHRACLRSSLAMKQPGMQQRPLQMINGVTNEFGQVFFDDATVPADRMVGAPGDGWARGDDRRRARARAVDARLCGPLRQARPRAVVPQRR